MSEQMKKALISAAQKLNPMGLNQGTAGNLSARIDGGIVITPSAVPYDQLTVDDIVSMNWDEGWTCDNPDRKPSSEWQFHLSILESRRDVHAVVHVHSPFATALACLNRDIPAFHYMVAVAGGRDIRCAPYATFGTKELSNHVLKALDGRRACLMANHGLIACGVSLDAALSLAVEVETLAAQYMRALSVGKPKILSNKEMDVVIAKFEKGYGKAD